MTSDEPGRPKISGTTDLPEVRFPRQRAQRLPAGERRAVILSEASIFFAKEGFAASTRDLADRLGVRQALLYKYYPSKEALLEAIFEKAFADHLVMDWAQALADRTVSLADRLTTFYLRYVDDVEGIGLRLFLRAALDGWPLPRHLTELLTEKLVRPLIGDLRREGGLPGFDAMAMTVGEQELVMSLHATVVFYCMRSHIYGIQVPGDVPAVVSLYVRNFLNGAHASLAALHDSEVPGRLAEAAVSGTAV